MTNRKFVQIDQIELACRIAEAFSGMTRPPGLTASQAMSVEMLTNDQRRHYIRAADAAIAYLMEAVEASGDVAELRYQTAAGGNA